MEAAGVTAAAGDCKLKANRNPQLCSHDTLGLGRDPSVSRCVLYNPCHSRYVSPSHLHFSEARARVRGDLAVRASQNADTKGLGLWTLEGGEGC